MTAALSATSVPAFAATYEMAQEQSNNVTDEIASQIFTLSFDANESGNIDLADLTKINNPVKQ